MYNKLKAQVTVWEVMQPITCNYNSWSIHPSYWSNLLSLRVEWMLGTVSRLLTLVPGNIWRVRLCGSTCKVGSLLDLQYLLISEDTLNTWHSTYFYTIIFRSYNIYIYIIQAFHYKLKQIYYIGVFMNHCWFHSPFSATALSRKLRS